LSLSTLTLGTGEDSLQTLFQEGKHLFAWNILALKPLEANLLKKADPASQSKPYQGVHIIATHRSQKEGELALPIRLDQLFGLGI
jgi:hypothetical protein